LTVRFEVRGYEGEENFPAEYQTPQENTRVSRADEHEERAAGAQAAAREGPKAPDRQHPIGIGFVPV
jgi:hypothetical protein